MSCKQEKYFQSVFPNGTAFKPAIDDLVFSEKIDKFKIKSSLWKFYLVIFPQMKSISVAQTEWIKFLTAKREEYKEIKRKHFINPEDESHLDTLGPLSPKKESIWNQYFENEKIMKTIKLDTDRLFQELPFFHVKEHLEEIDEILFLHVKHFSKYQYLQGYHELCGVIYYLFKFEMKSTLNADSNDPSYGYNFLFSHDEVAADCFWTYAALIDYMYELYHVEDDPNSTPFCILQSQNIIQNLVMKINSDVTYKCNIPDVFTPMISWLRLLYSRIFPIDDIMVIWTKIFAYYPDKKIIWYIAVAIILHNTDTILSAESSTDIILAFSRVDKPPMNEILRMAIRQLNERKPSQSQEALIALTKPICAEIGKMLPNLLVAPFDEIIANLEKIRDSIKAVAKSDTDTILNGTNDLSMLQSLPAFEIPPSIDIEIPPEISPLAFLPKASNQSSNASDLLFMEETHEGSKHITLKEIKIQKELFEDQK